MDPRRLVRFKDDFDRAVETEIMRSDRRRAWYVSGVFLVLAAANLALDAWSPDHLGAYFAGGYRALWVSLFLAGASLYELVYGTAIGLFLRGGRKFPMPPRYANAFIETSIPGLGVYLIAIELGPDAAFAVPAALAFFLFIGLSPLRLDFRLSAFTGLVASLEYLGLAWRFARGEAAAIGGPPDFLFAVQAAKALMLLVAGCIAAFVAYQIERRIVSLFKAREERNRITRVFGQHVSPAVMTSLLERPEGNSGELREVCVMFLDIRDFTAFSQHRPPDETVAHLNALFGFMVEIVNERGGFINKFLGDGFMAVFGAPLSSGRDSADALEAARTIVERLGAEISSARVLPTRIGIGVHTGKGIVGNVGSSLREEYTIVGDAVNLASRIESLNKTYGSSVLVSREALDAASAQGWNLGDEARYAARLGSVAVKGRDEPVELFRLA